jgi:hypothetical protein
MVLLDSAHEKQVWRFNDAVPGSVQGVPHDAAGLARLGMLLRPPTFSSGALDSFSANSSGLVAFYSDYPIASWPQRPICSASQEKSHARKDDYE